jgi:hypothetical protein
VFQDVLGIENFTKSEEAFAADALFLAYQSGDAASIQKTVQVGDPASAVALLRSQDPQLRHVAYRAVVLHLLPTAT